MINPQTGRPFVKNFFRDLAENKPCQIRIAAMYGYQCSHEPGNVVLCHISLPGIKAMGKKACTPDLLGAWGCSVCHELVDGRRKLPYSVEGDQIELWHLQGMARTIDEIRKLGYLP